MLFFLGSGSARPDERPATGSSHHAAELPSAKSISEQGSDGVKQRYTVWGLAGAAFLVTLGVTSWRNGLWSSDELTAQPNRTAASHSIPTPTPIPKNPFQTATTPPAAPPPVQTTQPPPQLQPTPEPLPQPAVGVASSPTQYTPPTAPDPIYEQSQEDYRQRAKLMEEIAAQARSRAQ